MPKPPPTSGVMTRNLSAASWNTCALIASLTSQPPCVLVDSVQRPAAASYSASATRASIEATTTRLLTMRTFVTRSACANSASVLARSPISQSNAWFPGTSGQTSGAPGCNAASGSVTEASGS